MSGAKDSIFAEINCVVNEQNILRGKIDAIIGDVQALQNNVDIEKSKNDDLQKELDSIRIELANAKSQLNDSRRELDDRWSELDNSRRKVDDLQKRLEDEERDNRNLQSLLDNSVYLDNKGNFDSYKIETNCNDNEKGQYAVECARYALENISHDSNCCEYIKKKFDSKYGQKWSCILAYNCNWSYSVNARTFITIEIGEYFFVLFC